MKKEYVKPILEIININEVDIIKTSKEFGVPKPGYEDIDDVFGN